MARRRTRRGGTWTDTVRDWLPSNWVSWHAEEGEETALLVEGDAAAAQAGDADGLTRTESSLERLCTGIGTEALHSASEAPAAPTLVISLCRVPDPSQVRPDRLLEALRLRVEETAACGPYSAILFLDPAPFLPSLRNLLASYFALSSLARKNVENVYLVGGGWKTSLFVRIFSISVLSLKAIEKGKLVECSTLSQLAERVGPAMFRQIEIPLEVYISSAKREASIRFIDEDLNSPAANQKLPLDLQSPLLRTCLRVLSEQGPTSLGIFRRSPSAANVAHLEAAYRRGNPMRLDLAPDAPYLAASLLKRHLANLSEPVLSRAVCIKAKSCPLGDDDAPVAFIQHEILPLIPQLELRLLKELIYILARIAENASENLMTASNLVICLCPALVGGIGPSEEEIEMCRVPGAEKGSMRGVGSRETDQEGSTAANTMGGVLKIMIEQ
ncbi:hypothetical protein JCM10908_006869 [Rhodotorula pacifica]|uniref:uncharacterized protein n=1 Tax=Rhodotorula pacifica TaxID=1495444 RepID=UPI003176DB9F